MGRFLVQEGIMSNDYYQFTHFLNKIILSFKSKMKKEIDIYIYINTHTHAHKQANNYLIKEIVLLVKTVVNKSNTAIIIKFN